MSEMIERLALAIEATMFAPHELPLDTGLHAKYRETARAVIEAMREPNKEMMAAVDCAGIKETWLSGRAWLAGYQAMIDAALSSQERT